MSSESLTTFRNIENDEKYDNKRSRASRHNDASNRQIQTTNDLAQKRQKLKNWKNKNNSGVFNVWNNSSTQNANAQGTSEKNDIHEG
jgi:hypothetical protein